MMQRQGTQVLALNTVGTDDHLFGFDFLVHPNANGIFIICFGREAERIIESGFCGVHVLYAVEREMADAVQLLAISQHVPPLPIHL